MSIHLAVTCILRILWITAGGLCARVVPWHRRIELYCFVLVITQHANRMCARLSIHTVHSSALNTFLAIITTCFENYAPETKYAGKLHWVWCCPEWNPHTHTHAHIVNVARVVHTGWMCLPHQLVHQFNISSQSDKSTSNRFLTSSSFLPRKWQIMCRVSWGQWEVHTPPPSVFLFCFQYFWLVLLDHLLCTLPACRILFSWNIDSTVSSPSS